MSKHISEETKGPRKGHAAGDTSIEQQASQLASDIKYKARQKMKGTSGSNLSPGQVQALYRSLLNSSPAPGGVKALVKKKLFGEEIDRGEKLVAETLENKTSTVLGRVFVEGGGQKVEVEEIEEAADQKFVIRVTDRATGNTTYRKADRAKIAELRANKNISSVEITGRKKADDAYGEKHEKKYGSSKGKNTVGDKDGDGTKEPDRHEYAGVKDRAIKKAMAKEEVIYEKEESGEKKLDVMKGKNTVKVNPTIGESIRAELDAIRAQKLQEQEAAMNQQNDEKKKEQLAKQQASKDKQMKMRILQNKMRAVRSGAEISASHQLEGDTLSESAVRYCPKCDKDETREECKYGGEYWDENSKPAKAEDEREMPTKATLFKNKLRARGIQVAGLTLSPRNMKTYDDLGEGMNMKDFKKQRSRQKQKEKRADEKTSPLRRAGIHADKASPERAARHRANVDPDYDHDDEESMYPGGKLKNPKKIRKAKALGELGEETLTERRREDKGKPRPAEPSAAFKAVSKMMGSSRLGVQPRGVKKKPGKKPPTAGQWGAPRSPAQKLAAKKAAAQRSQDNMSSRFD